jgi:hypothetical protein
MQIDGIVHDAQSGPAVISEGNFEIVHPAFCSGVVEIKTTQSNLDEFEQRLQTISGRYMHHLPASCVMGVVICSSDPKGESEIHLQNGGTRFRYNAHVVGWCPIFILFKEVEGNYEPYFDAIHAMIVAMHELAATTNYLH